ncbi:hypothetical protein QMG83_10765 [Salinibacterium sp. G-O1]|uniref:hypothetical protein n=1 Tax=Salinibacterium sp. G-O1 TaxID=3046208 RepID=UPI0024BB2833|nr:hypothetical protein [Salinibacterium sp. G-O1]MDJ0335705.1 hypothetical protein [Salinibacterium sp. G-O1]
MVAALTTAFGFEPVLTDVPDVSEGYPYRFFDWGKFRLHDDSAQAEAIGPLMFRFSVATTEPQTGGVIVETTDGVVVGDEIAKVSQLYPDVTPELLSDGQEYYSFETDVVFASDADGTQVPYRVLVRAIAGQEVDLIFAPDGGPGRF